MSDRLLAGANRLADQQEAYAGRSVVYSRKISGTVQSVTVTATVGNTTFRQTDTTGRTRILHGDRDYIIRAADLILNSATITPASGDTITDSTSAETYTVMAPGGEACWRKSDPFGIRLRIHCKKTG